MDVSPDEMRRELLKPESSAYLLYADKAAADEEFRASLFSFLGEKDWRLRSGALRVMEIMARKNAGVLESALQDIASALEDKHRIVRNHARIVLLELAKRDPEAVVGFAGVVGPLLEGKDSYDRFDGIRLLMSIGRVSPNTLSSFKEALEKRAEADENEQVRVEAKRALSMLEQK